MRIKLNSIAFVILLSTQSFGLSLGDHKIVMTTAIADFNTCFPDKINSFSTQALWMADLEEDTNLLRKDLLYSHFYNPEKKLNDLIRYDSSVRVLRLSEKIQNNSQLFGKFNPVILVDLGHLVHHIQDMAAPPHVVPVNHFFTDGFEKYAASTEDIRSGLSCDEIRNFSLTENYQEIHRSTALVTLALVRKTPVPVTIHKSVQENVKSQLSSINFWLPALTDNFGKYGYFGNRFGDPDITINQTNYSIPTEYYQNFKQSQLRLAVQSTLKALSFFYLQ